MFGFTKKPAQDAPSWADRLKAGLSRTRDVLLSDVFVRSKIDEALYDALESALLGADCGVEATAELLKSVRGRVRREGATDPARLKVLLRRNCSASSRRLRSRSISSAQNPWSS